MIQDVTSALVGNTIAVLHSNDGHNRASVLNLSNCDFGKANVSDLPFGLQVLKRAELILSRYFVIDAVQLEQVDAVEAQAPQAAFARRAQMLWPAVLDPLIRSGTIETSFGCDH